MVETGRAASGPPAASCVVLAAGQSSRFGSPKQLCVWNGKTLVRRAVEAALGSSAGEVVVVLGCRAGAVQAELRPLTGNGVPVGPVAGSDRRLKTVHNPRYGDGLSTSVQAGVRALDAETEAAVFVLGDQPLVTSETIDDLISAYRKACRCEGRRAEELIFVPVCEGRRGNPVLLGRGLFAELRMVSGDTGGRALIARHPRAVVEVPAGPEVLVDVDTEADLRRICGPEPATEGKERPGPA